MRVRWTGPAVDDIEAIRRHILPHNPAAAQTVAKASVAAAADLSKFPARGRPGRLSGTRELVVARLPFVIVYRIREHDVQILRVVHTARRWPEKT